MENKVRYGLAGLFILAMVVVVIIAYVNRDTFFKNTVTLEYSDGCVETYENGEMITPECINGRKLIEEQEETPEGFVFLPR